MSLNDAKVIDVHAHVVLEDTMGAAGIFGPEIGETKEGKPWFRIGNYFLNGVSYKNSAFMDADLRIQAMDKAGIDFQVLSPNPLTYFHFIDAPKAIQYCRQHNDSLAKFVAKHPNRFGGLAALPIQDIDAACDELTRSVKELGMLGAAIGTDIGRHLDNAELDPLYSKFVELDVPLFIHPAPAGIDGPKGDANLGQYELDILTGFAAQETIAVATLIYGGVLHRHPKLDICLSHAGGAVPFLFGRLKEAALRRPWSPEFLREEGAFEHYLGRLWFDAHVHDDRVLDFVVSMLGKERLLFGTNFAGWDQHDSKEKGDWMIMFADNARRLLRAS